MTEQFKNRMQQFEVTPPPAAWEHIMARLEDDAQYAGVSEKMYDYETTPPTTVWNKIESLLQSEPSITDTDSSKTSSSNNKTIYRLLAAAVFIGVIAMGWYFGFNNKKTNSTVATNNTAKDKSAPENKIPGNVADVNEQNKNNPEAGVVSSSPEVAANNDMMKPSPKNSASYRAGIIDNDEAVLKYAALNIQPSYPEQPIIINSPPIRDEKGAIIQDIDVLSPNGNYLVVTGPNGQLTRISSKFSGLISYLNDNSNETEEYLDRVIKESGIWKKRFREWRNKILQSSFIPASANFLDIISFKELIEEKQ